MEPDQAAKLVAIPTALLVSGYQFALSQNTLPIIFDQSVSVSTPVFKQVFDRGTVFAVPGAIIASAAFGYLAYGTQDATHRRLFTTGAVLSFGIIPFTRLFMFSGIQRLIEISDNVMMQKTTGGEVTTLLKAWTVQNWVRCGMMFAAGVVGLMTAFV